YHDIGVGFTLTATEKTYVSVYVMDWSKRVNDSNIITIGLYSGIQATTFYGYGNNSAETLDEHYGTALIETTVTCQGAYVTFAIEGAGNYQIVAYYDSQDLDEAAPVTPMLTGLFFDAELPAAQEENVIIPGEGEYVGYEANYTGADWERLGYGTDGYVVYYTADDTTYQAYTKGIYKNADGSDYTGLVTYSDAVKDAHNEWKADKELSGKLITRYASAFGEFSTIAEKSWKDDYTTGVLTVPGTQTPTWTRISTSRYEGDGATAFTIPASAFEKYDAIDVTIFHTSAFGPTDKAANFKTALFNMYDCGNGDNANTMSGYLLSSATVELPVNGPLYVTYRITSPGDYTLFLMSDDENVVRATTTGIFFDYVTGVMSNITYEADGATHSNPSTYVEGTLLPLTDASKDGYTFDGWYTDSEFKNKVTEISVDTTGDITIYAKFNRIYQTFNITYELDGGEHSNPATYTEGTGLVLADATKEGYNFVGWYTDNVYTVKVTEISATQTGDITLYAKFAKIPKVYNITYVVDGGVHGNPESYTEGSPVALTNAMKTGYNF
ncbi:MAG: InlB B-repeat-containing protein, partial [Clostridia bacterium]|nr:InlB B-repeat-containing protein [Clostridia bacterium]